LECPAADSADLDFTNEDFTLIAWVYNVGPGGSDMIMCQNVVDGCGWEFYVADTAYGGTLALRTNQAGSRTSISALGAFISSTWVLIGVTREGATGQFYVQGQPVDTSGGLLDPVSCAGAQPLRIGCRCGILGNFWAGNIAFPRIWDRKLSESGFEQIFEVERHWFGL